MFNEYSKVIYPESLLNKVLYTKGKLLEGIRVGKKNRTRRTQKARSHILKYYTNTIEKWFL